MCLFGHQPAVSFMSYQWVCALAWAVDSRCKSQRGIRLLEGHPSLNALTHGLEYGCLYQQPSRHSSTGWRQVQFSLSLSLSFSCHWPEMSRYFLLEPMMDLISGTFLLLLLPSSPHIITLTRYYKHLWFTLQRLYDWMRKASRKHSWNSTCTAKIS